MQTITAQEDINVLEKDRYGLRVVIKDEENLLEYQTDDGLIVGTGLKKIIQTDTSVNELQTKSDSLASQITALQNEKAKLDLIIIKAKQKIDEVISLRK